MKQALIVPAVLLAAAALSVTLTGCGAGISATSGSLPLATLGGRVHGGPNPIVGATVNLYETQTAASGATYGSAAKLLSTATTNSTGAFTFPNVATPYTCDSGQFAYVTVNGGTTGGGVNPNYLLMAALGSCTNLSTAVAQSATQIFVSEATTVAAAYALSNFTSVSGTTVNVGAPSSNAAASGLCTIISTSSTCVESGFAIAFANATGLASSVTYGGGAAPTGLFNSSMPSFPGSVIPVAMLNVVADAVQSCVNSTGGAAGDGTACGTLFTDTTPTVLANAPYYTSTTAPVDTLTAMIYLAKTPYLLAANGPTVATGTNPANPNTTGLFSLVSGSSYFQPTLAAAPTDFSLGIFYPGSSLAGASAATIPYTLTLDAAGTVYVLSADGGAPVVTTTAGITTVTTPSTATQSGLSAISNGISGPALLYTNAATTSTAFASPGTLAVDNLGDVFASNTASPTTIRMFTAASGALNATTPTISPVIGTNAINSGRSLTVDRSNNLWMTTDSTVSAIYKVPLTGAVTVYSANTTANESSLSGVLVDNNQNIWSCSIGVSNIQVHTVLIPNNAAAGNTALLSVVPLLPAAGSPATRKPGSFYAQPSADAAGNVYCPTNGGVSQNLPNAATPTSITSYADTYNGPLVGTTSMQVDGNNVMFGAGNTAAATGVPSTGRLWLWPITGQSNSATSFITNQTPDGLDPCFVLTVSSIGTYCSSNPTAFPNTGTPAAYSLLSYDTSMQIDAAGSAWNVVGNSVVSTTPAGIVQVIGTAAPIVPQLSAARFGVKP